MPPSRFPVKAKRNPACNGLHHRLQQSRSTTSPLCRGAPQADVRDRVPDALLPSFAGMRGQPAMILPATLACLILTYYYLHEEKRVQLKGKRCNVHVVIVDHAESAPDGTDGTAHRIRIQMPPVPSRPPKAVPLHTVVSNFPWPHLPATRTRRRRTRDSSGMSRNRGTGSPGS